MRNRRVLAWGSGAIAAVAWLMLYRLGSLTGGLSMGELSAAAAPVGWHGIYHDPSYLPLELIRSLVFSVFPAHGQFLTRLPDAALGAGAIVCFGVLVRLWHGWRTALFATAMFAAAAWTLHVSRLASFDVVYLWSMPTLLLSHFLMRKYYRNPYAWCANMAVWGLLLYVPGMVWFVAADIIWQRRFLVKGWGEAGWRPRLAYVSVALAWLPLLILGLARNGLRAWLGLPSHLAAGHELLKQFAAVPVHLFIRGPEYPQLWLGRAPILDIFALATCFLGIYFYASNWKASRSRYLALVTVLGWVLVALGGPVTLSLMVPLLYVSAATGLAYLLHEWLKIFPNNPVARGVGIGLITVAVGLGCAYNYRAYFIAWPHDSATKATFQYHRRP